MTGPPQPAGSVRRLVVISWNVGVGCGDLGGLLSQLRADSVLKRGDGLVVLAQEVYRVGLGVPTAQELRGLRNVEGPGRIRKCHPTAVDRWASDLRLHMVYAPSMRNGAVDSPFPEDRGNAILSNLPLHDIRAIEPPIIGQRRVAVSAVLRLGPGAEGPGLRVVSAHLDVGGSPSYLGAFVLQGRLRQAWAIVDAVPLGLPIILAGDLNSWGGSEEPALRYLRRKFPHPGAHPRSVTKAGFWGGLFGLRLDHMFVKLPDDWRFSYEVHKDERGSDHRPLVGVLEIR